MALFPAKINHANISVNACRIAEPYLTAHFNAHAKPSSHPPAPLFKSRYYSLPIPPHPQSPLSWTNPRHETTLLDSCLPSEGWYPTLANPDPPTNCPSEPIIPHHPLRVTWIFQLHSSSPVSCCCCWATLLFFLLLMFPVSRKTPQRSMKDRPPTRMYASPAILPPCRLEGLVSPEHMLRLMYQ